MSDDFDLVVHDGTLVTAAGTARGDVGIRDGRIAALADRLPGGARRLDAGGRYVLPGGIEGHCHIAQESAAGLMNADDYLSGSRSALAGGVTSFIPFAAQAKGETPLATLERYRARAEGASLIDWGWHLIVSDPTPEALAELPAAFDRGVTSFKVFMTYAVRLDDRRFLDVLALAKAHGALTMVHAENHGMVEWATDALLAAGATAPKFHAPSRPAAAEAEAIRRAIALAGLVDAPLFIVHVSTPEGAAAVAEARAAGARIWAETCPHYLVLTADDLDRPGMDGARFVCSPPLRDAASAEALWRHLGAGTFDLVSSDHAPYRADASGKFADGPDAPFPKLANGMPGIAARLPLLWSEGVATGRLSVESFAALSSTNAARLYGLAGRKGSLMPGADADLVLWNPEARWTLDLASQHDAMDYSPYEGREITGRPETVVARGEVVFADGAPCATPGRGRFLARGRPDLGDRPGTGAPELRPERTFGARIAP